MISTEHAKKSCVKVLATYLDRTRTEASQIVTMPNGSAQSLDGTSIKVLQKRKSDLS